MLARLDNIAPSLDFNFARRVYGAHEMMAQEPQILKVPGKSSPYRGTVALDCLISCFTPTCLCGMQETVDELRAEVATTRAQLVAFRNKRQQKKA